MSAVTQRTSEMEQYPVTTEEGDARPVSGAVVEAVAAVEGVKSSDLDAHLYDSLDPDALDSLYATAMERDEHLRLTFTLAGYEIVVETEGHILIRELDEAPSR